MACIGLVVLICTLRAFWIRMIPLTVLAGSGNMIAGPDARYHLRLPEVALANNFGYIFFEPITLHADRAGDRLWPALYLHCLVL